MFIAVTKLYFKSKVATALPRRAVAEARQRIAIVDLDSSKERFLFGQGFARSGGILVGAFLGALCFVRFGPWSFLRRKHFEAVRGLIPPSAHPQSTTGDDHTAPQAPAHVYSAPQ